MLKTNDLAERRKTATEAKARLLDRFKTRMTADDPAVAARAAERRAISEARAERQAVRDAEKAAERAAAEALRQQAEDARLAEEAEREAAVLLEVQNREQAALDRASRVVKDEAERKRIRDERYAARKARKHG